MRRQVTGVVGTARRRMRWATVRVWPDGGQGQARRNAWAAMVNDHIAARARADAERALALAAAGPGVGMARPGAESARP